MASGSASGLSPREHIEHIRKTWFSIGAEEANMLAPMLDKAVKYLSAELYTKDVHFLMELIQNAEDNDYLEGVDPSLEFVITSRDITATGAPVTLILFNNEKGFSAKNIESICSVGNSTKVGHRKRGYIGEKGIGFKSVFLITAQPHLFSNGYQIRFNEKPCAHCQLGYIVPEWIEDSPFLSDIQVLYGSSSSLPRTVLVLPLKPDKVKPVKQQLSSLQPEVLLFLSKIKRLSVREDNQDPMHDTVSAIAVTKETNFAAKRNIDAESYTLHLCAEEKGEMPESACSYYMWKQRFPVKQENRFERRMEVEEWVITLAFPNGERLHRGGSSPGVYAYLPTEMVTNFPFIIQADFLLASSRETILLDNRWNKGILDCVPSAFVNALVSLVKTIEDAPISCLTRMFNFLPVKSSFYELLNVVRNKIKENLAKENIIPIESNKEQKFFHRPAEVGRIMLEFRNILSKAQRQGVSLRNLSSHGCYVLNSSFDRLEYNPVLEFLGVQQVDNEWYAKCIVSSNMVPRVSEEVYLDLLLYVAKNWRTNFCNTQMGKIPLIKYVSGETSISFCSIIESSSLNGKLTLCRSSNSGQISWINEWNSSFRFAGNFFFLPKVLQEAIQSLSLKEFLVEWLDNEVKVKAFTVYSYAEMLIHHLKRDRKIVVAYAHFLYQSLCFRFLSTGEVGTLCKKMPLVDSNGCVTTAHGRVLVPASGSNWSELIASNPWTSKSYVELGEDYSCPVHFANRRTTGKELTDFLKIHLGAADIPEISPPDVDISSMSAPLTKQNVFLLLRWIRYLRRNGIPIPPKFLTSVQKGGWLRSTLNGSPSFRPPSHSFFLSNNEKSNWGNMLQSGSVLIPLVDQSFYGCDINCYKEELKAVGVMFEFREACMYIGKHLVSLAASSSLSRSHVFSMLKFIRFLRQNYLSPNDFIATVEQHRWLVTCEGLRFPAGSVLYDDEWEIAREISDIPFIDENHYGKDLSSYKEELKLLGVVVGFDKNYEMVASHLKESFCSSSLTSKAFLLILNCLRYSGSSDKLVVALKKANCLKTSIGYRFPSECYLSDPEWGGLLQIFSVFPLVDDKFYPEIYAFKMELKKLGVKVNFEDAVKAFSIWLKQQGSSSSIGKDNVFNLLSCYRKLKTAKSKELASHLKKSITDVCWLRTRLVDYRSPGNCILFGPEWESISLITVLPFVDDGDNCYGKGLHGYRKELMSFGVITDLKVGVKLVLAGLRFPSDPSCILPTSVLSLLQCIRIMLEKKDDSLNGAFLKNATQEWLKTTAGYRCADKCILFDPKWKHVKPTDGPFIDENFYGASLGSYKQELSAWGVIVDDLSKVCMLLADHLDSLSDFAAIVRIYNFFKDQGWKPRSKDSKKIWIPNGDNNGVWVHADECVLHDKNGLFGLQLHVLDTHYEESLLYFFSSGFEVKSNPSLEDHCLLWKQWENAECNLSQAQCCAFWQCVLRHWGLHTRSTLAADLVKLPAVSKSGEILLVAKSDVFLGDDLLLNDRFECASPLPLFIWYPRPSLLSLPRTKLSEMYKNIGVRGISESVKGQEVSLTDSTTEHKELIPGESLFKRGLMKVILGFLAGTSVNMDVQMRHEAVKCFLNLTVYETSNPLTIEYSLTLSSEESVSVRVSRMVRWQKESSKFFTQKQDTSGACGWKNRMEYATNFAQAVADGLLWEKEGEISELSELIKFVVLLEFDEEAIEYLMKSKNLQIFLEDEEFLSVAYPSGGQG